MSTRHSAETIGKCLYSMAIGKNNHEAAAIAGVSHFSPANWKEKFMSTFVDRTLQTEEDFVEAIKLEIEEEARKKAEEKAKKMANKKPAKAARVAREDTKESPSARVSAPSEPSNSHVRKLADSVSHLELLVKGLEYKVANMQSGQIGIMTNMNTMLANQIALLDSLKRPTVKQKNDNMKNQAATNGATLGDLYNKDFSKKSEGN